MQLEVTVVGGPGAGSAVPLEPTELSVTWPAGSTPSGLSLEQALARRWVGTTFTVAGKPLAALHPGTEPLVDGAVAVARRGPAGLQPELGLTVAPTTGPRLSQRCVAVLVVTGGPGSGAVFELHRGSYTIGRGHCRIRIADPALSRQHCTLTVGPHSITLAGVPGSGGITLYRRNPSDGALPPASASRVKPGVPAKPLPVNARSVKGCVCFDVGHILSCGSSTLELRFQDHPPHAVDGSASNFREGSAQGFPPELLDASVLDPLSVPHQGGPARGMMATAATALVSLVFGVVLAMATGSWMFLSFAAMGALTLLVPLVGGSARRKAVQRAVRQAAQQDGARLAGAFPDAGTLLLAAHAGARPSVHGDRAANAEASAAAPARIAVRLGTAPRAAAVSLVPADPAFSPPVVPFLPACIRLGANPVEVSGPGMAVHPMVHHVLMQLDAAGVPVVVLGSPLELPLAARLLPLTTLASSTGSALRNLELLRRQNSHSSSIFSPVLVVINAPLEASLLTVPGVALMHFSVLGPENPLLVLPGSVTLAAAGNRFQGTVAGEDFMPDGVPATVFASYARRRARTGSPPSRGPGNASSPAAGQHGLAANVLPGPEAGSMAGLRQNWQLAAGGALRPVPVGQSATGPVMFDFGRDGPHLLLAGTTGSGKSEFLRTLVGSLAAAHSPADVQFVFIDFKGGAGLGVLGKLPHTSSLITDLGGQGMDRTLCSLRAELNRREAALAEADAEDNDGYRAMAHAVAAAPEASPLRSAHTMAHLVIVIDEFRVLVDQFPDAMAELMRIAAVGRSLGIHLVMATQRPQGALSADIRANVTSSICLRVQSALDSVDVIGTPDAAGIDVNAPGRAFLSRAGSRPMEFHTATLRLPEGGGSALPLVELAVERLAREAPPPIPAAEGGSDVAALAQLMERAWQEALAAEGGVRSAPAVVAAELPPVLADSDMADSDMADSDMAGSSMAGGDPAATVAGHSLLGRHLALGLVDVPQGQCLEPLRWHPGSQSHLACFGTATETSRAVALVAGRALECKSIGDRPVANHARDTNKEQRALVYFLDGDGTLTPLASSPWVGACLAPGSLRTAAHLVQRLIQAVRTDSRLHLVCITDWGRWVSALRASPWHSTEDDLAELIRFSPPNLVMAIGGGRELLSASFLAAIPNRMFLSHRSTSESTVLWPRLPRFRSLAGRAAIAGPINNFSGVHHGAEGLDAGETLHIAQLAGPVALGSWADSHDGTAPDPPAGMLRVRELPSQVGMAGFRALVDGGAPPGMGTVAGQGLELLLGVGGDGSDPVTTPLAPGSVLPVLGGPGTGKSSFIRALQQLHARCDDRVNHQTGHQVANPVDGLPVGRLPGNGLPEGTEIPSLPHVPAAAGPGGILWLDDASALSPQQLHTATLHLADGGSIVAAVPYPGPALSMVPVEWGIRTAQQAIVLMPQRPSDADLFGVRLDTLGAEPPGRAVLLDRGRRHWFQFPAPGDHP